MTHPALETINDQTPGCGEIKVTSDVQAWRCVQPGCDGEHHYFRRLVWLGPFLAPAQWFVVITRYATDEHGNHLGDLAPVAIGPYDTSAEAEAAGNADDGIVFSLLTVDAKNESWVADECFWTMDCPDGAERIEPSDG